MASDPLWMGKFLLVLVLLSFPFIHCENITNTIQSECLKVPNSEFAGSIVNTIDVMQQVVSILSSVAKGFGDFRLSNAIDDCLDLMDSSADELSWTLSATQNQNGKHNSTGNLSSDLRTWLSATLFNQDTCSDGFDGTNGIVKDLVSGSLDQITSLVLELLGQVHPVSDQHESNGQTPAWFRSEDRKLLQANGMPVDVVVAQDGTGNFTNITSAILSVPDYSLKRYVIYVKRGVYKEYVEIKKKKWNIMMIGDGMDATVISGNHNYVDGWTTFRSATFAVSGRGFIARDITFENTAGPEKHMAVALRSDSDLSVFYRCEFRGYQDTLYTHSMRQFYRDCKISGTVDFIFGDGTVVFQNCQIQARQALPNQKNSITAHGRKYVDEPTGFSIQFCNISAHPDLLATPVNSSTPTYLGRPWKQFSRTIIMQSFMSNIIKPEGWLEWNGSMFLDSLFYGEYMNYGPGAGLGSRVTWPGYQKFNESGQAKNYTVSEFIEGNLWLPSTGVKYTAGFGV
ncbi:pectinesterase/pectinesterase inhibitor PPE8B-like [Rosa rugosa]|uniref:pectinesterase/pectinesterase inhibitor PPE8B-like n=1 Tax=Rosa rugosa TaxID=74645 RepID=UPI002B4013BF|nr:pectinesterase/pectinesterase inhibitor PPE8B-like [Rosa rugosa]